VSGREGEKVDETGKNAERRERSRDASSFVLLTVLNASSVTVIDDTSRMVISRLIQCSIQSIGRRRTAPSERRVPNGGCEREIPRDVVDDDVHHESHSGGVNGGDEGLEVGGGVVEG